LSVSFNFILRGKEGAERIYSYGEKVFSSLPLALFAVPIFTLVLAALLAFIFVPFWNEQNPR